MVDLVHNFGARKRKCGAIFKRVADATPEVVGEVDQHPTDDGLNVQAIPVSDSPEMPFHGQSAPETALLMDLGEVSPTHTGVQEDIPQSRLPAGQTRLHLPGLGAVGRCFPTGCW